MRNNLLVSTVGKAFLYDLERHSYPFELNTKGVDELKSLYVFLVGVVLPASRC